MQLKFRRLNDDRCPWGWWRLGPVAICGVLCIGLSVPTAAGDEENPFRVTPAVRVSNGVAHLVLAVGIPAHHHIYSDRLSFEWNGAPVTLSLPPARAVADRFSASTLPVYESDVTFDWPLPVSRASAMRFAMTFQGCSETECYFPETREWLIGPDNSIAPVSQGAEPVASTAPIAPSVFRVAGRATGYLGSARFLRFLDESTKATLPVRDFLSDPGRFGMAATLGLILLGGLALNLTPCVLPMIPVNLAILGAGSRNANRKRGFLLGSAYGVGMALAYGALGLAVVLTGSKFGVLNASPWFNLAMAAVFAVLGLAMFDKLAIDFSRFQPMGGSGGGGSTRGAFLAAGVMGLISALLAGACVAPVVISVLLLATTLYQQGTMAGLLLPFVLGAGMASPWPFAAAGLSFLPKPGAWMTRVKYGFGVIIFGFAAWYAWLGWSLSGLGHGNPAVVAARSQGVQQLEQALDGARTAGRPVVIDFWASWCKNCEAMEHTTFRDPAVRRRLDQDFVFIRFQAEHLNDSLLKPVLDRYGVIGLPSYVVLTPGPAESGRPVQSQNGL